MKYLKLFESHQIEAEVAKICHRYNITDWELNSDGLVDVDCDIDLSKKGLTELPLKFGEVTGFFNCDKNKLNTLEGSPHTVGSYFSCDENQLNSLEFAPKSVGDFYCRDNNIRSFEGLVNINQLYCFGNPVFEIWRIIDHNQCDTRISVKWDSEKMDFFNDLDIIRGEEIVLDRLNFFLSEIGLNPVETVKGYKIID
jgi:hypothetical protein